VLFPLRGNNGYGWELGRNLLRNVMAARNYRIIHFRLKRWQSATANGLTADG